LGEYLEFYTDSGFLPIFKSSLILFNDLKELKVPKKIHNMIIEIYNKTETKITDIEKTLKPLQFHTKKIRELPTFTPDFQDSYRPSLLREPNKEKRELKYLQKQFKREYKGASRELRKDSEFLEREKEKDRKKLFKYKDKKRKEIFTMLENQQSEDNKFQRSKKRKLNF